MQGYGYLNKDLENYINLNYEFFIHKAKITFSIFDSLDRRSLNSLKSLNIFFFILPLSIYHGYFELRHNKSMLENYFCSSFRHF